MMTSLFSMFDPSAIFNIQMNWMMMIMCLLLYPSLFWCFKSRNNKMMEMIFMTLNKEFSSLFSSTIMFKGSTLIMIVLFMIILLNNISSNFPYSFCCSAHILFSFSLAIPIWMSIILFYWMNLTKTMFSHLVPTGTPPILMPLMVIIELVSNIIRPMALSVRLTANMIAGHLLMALLGNNFNTNSSISAMILLIQLFFLSFEMTVAIIQSYVFSVLMTLYSSEIS